MLRFVVSLMVISIMNHGVISVLATSSEYSTGIPDWSNEVLHRVNQYETLTKTTEGIREELRKMEELSVMLDAVTKRMNLMCGNIITSNTDALYAQVGSDDFDLCRNIQNVDRFYRETREYDKSFSDKTVDSSQREILWGDTNLPDTLQDIRTSLNLIVNRSKLSLAERAILNVQSDCDTNISPQQEMYNAFILLIMSEMKGLVTLERIYLSKRLINGTETKYTAEVNFAKETCESRLAAYRNMLNLSITISPKQIRRCDVENPKHGSEAIELRHYSRVKMLNKRYLRQFQCRGCPNESELQDLSSRSEMTIHSCVNLGSTVMTCPAKYGSYREYLWWQDSQGKYYGHNDSCKDSNYIVGLWVSKTRNVPRAGTNASCDVCACSVDLKRTRNRDKTTIWRINLSDQVSDVFHNMVVTGIKFVKADNGLHLQIRQSNFSNYGVVDEDAGWKQLDHRFTYQGVEKPNVPMYYMPLRHDRKTIYFDDIQVPEGHVVTGVRFQLAEGSAFKLQVFANRFDFKSGKVDQSAGRWLDAQSNPVRPKDYERKRIPIALTDSDDPLRNTYFQYDLESNKMVTITHTDIYKDAGQTTLPLFHGRPVITRPPFPLGGIGLSFRGKEGYGGFAAPRIYTLDVSNHLSSLGTSQNATN